MNSNTPAQEPLRPAPKKPNVPLLGAVAALGAMGAFALLRPPAPAEAPQPTATSVSSHTHADGSVHTGSHDNPLSAEAKEPKLLLFVPSSDGEMQKRSLPAKGDIPKDAAQARDKLTMQAVQALLEAEPELFPSGAALLGATVKDGVTTLNFSSSFTEPSAWQGSARTTSILDALVMTVEATQKQLDDAPPTGKGGLLILSEGKPVPALGEMDMSEPYGASAPAPEGSPQ